MPRLILGFMLGIALTAAHGLAFVGWALAADPDPFARRLEEQRVLDQIEDIKRRQSQAETDRQMDHFSEYLRREQPVMPQGPLTPPPRVDGCITEQRRDRVEARVEIAMLRLELYILTGKTNDPRYPNVESEFQKARAAFDRTNTILTCRQGG